MSTYLTKHLIALLIAKVRTMVHNKPLTSANRKFWCFLYIKQRTSISN
jgi:hypothetical protein